MKNNRAKRKAFEWHHSHRYNNFSKPYMRKVFNHTYKKRASRFNISGFKVIINRLFAQADKAAVTDNFPHSKKGDRAAVMFRGVSLDYRNMTFKIIGGDGVKRNKKNNGKRN